MPSWTWIDEGREVSEEQLDELKPTLDALAKEWTAVHRDEEQRLFRTMADLEEGRDVGPDWGECPVCDDGRPLGLGIGRLVSRRRIFCFECGKPPHDPNQDLVGITCPYCNGVGHGVQAEQEWKKRQRAQEAIRQVRVEVIEGMLEKYGARMMRPYEHWNEDERLMQYLESDR